MNDSRRIAESSREAVKLIETLPTVCANRAFPRCQASQLAHSSPFEVAASVPQRREARSKDFPTKDRGRKRENKPIKLKI